MEYITNDEIDKLKVPELKDYLRKHGQIIGGKSAEHVQRAKGISVLQVKPVDSVRKDDDNFNQKRQIEKLITPLGEVIPDPLSLKGWTKELSVIPHFSETDIYNYLVLRRKAERQLKRRVFYDDRHVHDVQVHLLEDECSHMLVRCKVIPSLPSANKKENPDYSVWACLSKVSGNVQSADCNCTTGLGEACNHIGALLYALVDITDKKEDGVLASTSHKCTWNNPRKRRLSPKKAVDIFSDKENTQIRNRPQFIPTVCENRFRERLVKNNSIAGWLTNFECETSSDTSIPLPQLENVSYMYRDNIDLNSQEVKTKFQEHFREMKITEEQCGIIEMRTRGQSTNDFWKNQRKGRITSSNFGKVASRKDTTAPDNLVKQMMGYSTFDNKYVKWGRDHEPAARRSYMNKNKSYTVTLCGLVINPMYPHLGASPDGFVHDPSLPDCDGVIEKK